MNGFVIILLLGCAVFAAAQNHGQGPPRPPNGPPPGMSGGGMGGRMSGGFDGGAGGQGGGQGSGLSGPDSTNQRQQRSVEPFFIEIAEKLYQNEVVNGGARGRRSPQEPPKGPPKAQNMVKFQ